jgi:hypothetical protein
MLILVRRSPVELTAGPAVQAHLSPPVSLRLAPRTTRGLTPRVGAARLWLLVGLTAHPISCGAADKEVEVGACVGLLYVGSM